METTVLLMVLVASACHAAWNALMKTSGDAVIQMMVINVVGALVGLAMVVMFGLPDLACWPYLLASVIVHQFYYAALILGYRHGELSDVYPIARGIAPLLVAGGAFIYAGEALRPGEIAAVFIISAGILSLGLTRQWTTGSKRALTYALLTGLTIAIYTVTDGMGGRTSGNVLAYIGLLFAIEGVPITGFILIRRRGHVLESLAPIWRTGVIGGLLAICAYGIVIWAMSTSYMTFVSALRETSVVLAALIGTFVLKESFGKRRLTGVCVVVCGVIWLHLA